jgi:urease accessory protein
MDPQNPQALLRLLHLASPALPIGAFAYSQGLEAAAAAGWVHDEASTRAWILGLLSHGLRSVEVPLLGRLHAAFSAGDQGRARALSDLVHALRGSRELQEEERRLGSALARALATLDVPEAAAWAEEPRRSHLALFALAAAHFRLPVPASASAFLFAWCENQVAAALRLLPLGQSSGLRLLDAAVALIPDVVAGGLALADDDIGFGAPAHALGSAQHETQYSRIFRS